MKLEKSSSFGDRLETIKPKYASNVAELRDKGFTNIFAGVLAKDGQWGKYYSVFFLKNDEYISLKFKGLKLPKDTANGVYLVSYPKGSKFEIITKEHNGKTYKTLVVDADLDEVDFIECEQDGQYAPMEDDGLPF